MSETASTAPSASSTTATTAASAPAAAVAVAAPEGVAQASAAPKEFKTTLNDFCVRLSARDKRVELIHAFRFDERAAGRNHDFPSAYQARFAVFGNRPTI